MPTNKLDSMFADLEKLVTSKSGISASDAEKVDIESACKEVLLLKIIANKRAKIQEGSLSGNLGLTRFMGDWNFDKDIEDLGYRIEELYRSTNP